MNKKQAIEKSLSAKKAISWAFFLIYLFFALYLFLSSLSIWFNASEGTALESSNIFFNDYLSLNLFFAGIVDIALAFIILLYLTILFSGKLGIYSKGVAEVSYNEVFKGDDLVVTPFEFHRAAIAGIFIAALFIFYIILAGKFFSKIGLLFYVLVGINFLIKNPIHILLGKTRKELIARYNETYKTAVFALLISAGLFFFLILFSILLQSGPWFYWFKEIGIFTTLNFLNFMILINSISIYYIALAIVEWSAVKKLKNKV